MTRERALIHRKIFLYLLYSIIFFIPVFGRLLPGLIGLLLINWLIEGNYKRTFSLVFREKTRFHLFSFSFLYLLYVAGLIHTSNFHYAAGDLETKLSLLIFPLIFVTSGVPLFTREEWRAIFKVFIAGCVTGSLILIGRATYATFIQHESGAFYYTKLSWNYHPSYLALYFSFAGSVLTSNLLFKNRLAGVAGRVWKIMLLLLFSLMIVLLSSKSGLLIWLTLIGFYVFVLWFRYKRWFDGITFGSIALTVFFLFLFAFPNAVVRVSEATEDLSKNEFNEKLEQSTGERMAVWKVSKVIILKHFLFGVGTGDVKDVLIDNYREKELNKVLKKRLNAHNQYLQTFLTIGVFGFIVLALLFILPAFRAFREESYIYFTFLVIVAISLLFESMFETQAGVIFYALFNAALFTINRTDQSRNSFDIQV